LKLFKAIRHRPLTAPLVAKLAPPVAPPNQNVWHRPCEGPWRSSMSFFAMKWYLTRNEMAPNKLKNCTQCCFSKFDYLYLIFCESSLHFKCLFHSQSFRQVWPNLALRNMLLFFRMHNK